MIAIAGGASAAMPWERELLEPLLDEEYEPNGQDTALKAVGRHSLVGSNPTYSVRRLLNWALYKVPYWMYTLRVYLA